MHAAHLAGRHHPVGDQDEPVGVEVGQQLVQPGRVIPDPQVIRVAGWPGLDEPVELGR